MCIRDRYEDEQVAKEQNNGISAAIAQLSQRIPVSFITKSLLEREDVYKRQYKNDAENSASCGGKRGIRTLERVLAVTRFPIGRLRPAQPSFHDFNILSYPRRIVKNFFQIDVYKRQG